MRRLNIAFYTDSYLPAVDGVVTSIINFRKELERRGHHVYVFASGSSESKKRYSNSKTFIYAGRTFKPYPQYNVALFPYNSALKFSDLGIDLVHAQTPFMMGLAGLLAAKFSKRPLISTFHTMVTDRRIVEAYYPPYPGIKQFAKRSLWMYTKFFYKTSNITIAPSKSTERILRRYGINKTIVIPNSVDMKKFNPSVGGSRIRESLKIKPRDRMILYVGRMSKEKRLDVLLKAARILIKKNPNTKLVMGGHGPMEDEYKRAARTLGIQQNVIFTGFVPFETLPNLYAAADVMCLPSTFETQGIVSIEAMAVGKPVVGADALALKELIQNGRNGEKFRSGDYVGCAKKIEKVLNDPDAYKERAVSTAREFSVERTTDRLLDIYNLVLSQAIY
jgi:1,2-diacylglycerol 3-alpha-glucosyltransferase